MRILMASASSANRQQAVLRGALRTHGHAVDSAPLSSVCEYVELYEYDLVVVILGRPATGAVNLVARLRCVSPATPMLVLTGPSSPEQRSHVLDAGADDCVPEPVHIVEFLARVRALLRRAAKERLPVLRCGDLVLDPAARQVWRAGALLPLTRKELAILEYLMRRSGHVVIQDVHGA